MTSKLVVNTIEADTGISSVSFGSSISLSSTSKFFFSNAGIDIGADTNINRPASGVLGFNINSSEKVRITSDGVLKLTGQSSSFETAGLTHHTNNNLYIRGGTTGLVMQSVDGNESFVVQNDYVSASTGGIERLRIKSDGTIGINTTGNYGNIALSIYGADVGEGTAKGQLILKDNAAYDASPTAGIIFQGIHAAGSQAIFAAIRGFKENASNGNYAGALAFDVRAHGAVAYEALRITSSGYLKLGSTDGSAWHTIRRNTTTNNAIKDVLHVHSSVDGATAAAGYGVRLNFSGEQSNGNEYTFGGIAGLFSSTGATYGDLAFYTNNNGTNGERARITSTGNFGINTTSPSDKLHVNGGDIIISTTNAPNLRLVKADNSSGDATTRAFFGLASGNNNFFNGTVDNDLCIVAPTNGRIHFGYANSIKLRMENDGTLFSAATYNNTTASGSRAVVMPNNTGEFFASTSSRRFKTNITTLTDALADKILECRPVSFNSTCDVDNKSKIFYGLIAEEVHEIDTSLVAYEDENAETPVAAGVQYDRFVPHLINLVKRQKAQIEALETRIAALEGS